MGTRKYIKPKNSNKRFRKTRSKRQRGGGPLEHKLLEAVKNNKLAEVIEALAAGANVNANSNGGYTALIWASIYGRTEIVAMLLEQPGIDVNITNTNGETALDFAIYDENTEIVKLLIRKGATIPDDREDLKEVKKNIERKKDHENLDIIQAATRSNKTTMPASGKRIFSWDPGQGPGAETFKEYLGGKRKTRKSKKSRRKSNRKTRRK